NPLPALPAMRKRSSRSVSCNGRITSIDSSSRQPATSQRRNPYPVPGAALQTLPGFHRHQNLAFQGFTDRSQGTAEGRAVTGCQQAGLTLVSGGGMEFPAMTGDNGFQGICPGLQYGTGIE